MVNKINTANITKDEAIYNEKYRLNFVLETVLPINNSLENSSRQCYNLLQKANHPKLVEY